MKPANAEDIVAGMAAHLREAGIPDTEREAIRLLATKGFRYGDVLALADDALVAARQDAVTEVMASDGGSDAAA